MLTLVVMAWALTPNRATAQLANTAWPKFQQNNLNSAVGVGGSSNGALRWQFYAPFGNGASAAIGVDGTIYVGSSGLYNSVQGHFDCYLYALNSDGTQKWAFPASISSCPAIAADGTIYVGSNDGNLYAINPDGTKNWGFNFELAAPTSPAIGTDGTIYVGAFYTGRGQGLCAVSPDGAVDWVFQTGSVASSPAIGTDGTIYTVSQDGVLYAINADGSLQWNVGLQGIAISSPAVGADGTIYVGSSDDSLYAISQNGMQKWRFATGGQIASSPVIASDGTVYVGSSDHRLYAVKTNGKAKWSFVTDDDIANCSPAIGADGTIYVGSFDSGNSKNGKLYAINPNGTLKWKFGKGMAPSSLAIDASGTVYMIDGYAEMLYAIGTTPPSLASVNSDPSSLTGGSTSTGVLDVNPGSKGSGELVVSLTSNNRSVTVPKSITVPAGQTEVVFAIKTTAVPTQRTVILTATSAGVSKTTSITLNAPSLASLSATPATVTAGKESSGTITITSAAPIGGLTIKVSSSESWATLPSTVTVPNGKMSITFTIRTKPKSKGTAIISADLAGASLSCALTTS